MAARGLVDPGEQTQQRGLAGTVVADEPDAVAFLQRHRDVAQSLDDHDIGVVAADRPARLTQEGLLQGPGLGVEDGKVDARAARFDADPTHDAAPDADTGPERTRRADTRVPGRTRWDYRYWPVPGWV